MNITVMSRRDAIRDCYHIHERPTVIISISDPNMIYTSAPFTSKISNITAILPLSFADADRPGLDVYGRDADVSDLMSDEDANRVVTFVNLHKDADLIVHCDAGISRSAGVAAAIMKAVNGDDSPIFDNGRYRPNMWCYRKVLTAFMNMKGEEHGRYPCIHFAERRSG